MKRSNRKRPPSFVAISANQLGIAYSPVAQSGKLRIKLRSIRQSNDKLLQQPDTVLYVAQIDHLDSGVHVPERDRNQCTRNPLFRLKDRIRIGTSATRGC